MTISTVGYIIFRKSLKRGLISNIPKQSNYVSYVSKFTYQPPYHHIDLVLLPVYDVEYLENNGTTTAVSSKARRRTTES